MNFVELLAPARDLQSAVAAVDYGADAVYIGGAKFGARHAAGNSAEQIARVAEYAHRYGVRVHATLNTLIYDDELETAERQARELIAAGVDALIVQDMALRRMDLPVELHASTQVCNMTPEQARFLGECGFALERALSLDEIRAICAATNAEVECFVHGAICVGYSGRCFLSRSMSERSGNRGACSQPCRLTYDLTDGSGRTYLAGKHLLSVRDLNLSAHVGELLDAAVSKTSIISAIRWPITAARWTMRWPCGPTCGVLRPVKASRTSRPIRSRVSPAGSLNTSLRANVLASRRSTRRRRSANMRAA